MDRRYTEGLHDLGGGTFAYLQPDGGWGLSNAGLVVDNGHSLVVDTLVDVPSAGRMLAAMRRAVPNAQVETVVNTHAHPDHTGGNGLFTDAEIISSIRAAGEMLAISRREDPMGQMISNWRDHGDAGAYLHDVLGSRFALSVERQVMPTRVFEHELVVHIGGIEVRLVDIGPAHTAGDVVVLVPARRVVFTGDVVFHRVHPMVAGVPVTDWMAACRRILAWDVDVVVPGHGPVTDLSGVRCMLDYLEQLWAEARVRFDAGMTWTEAVADIPLDQFRGWVDGERVAMTVAHLFHDFGGPSVPLAEILGFAGRRRRGAA